MELLNIKNNIITQIKKTTTHLTGETAEQITKSRIKEVKDAPVEITQITAQKNKDMANLKKKM